MMRLPRFRFVSPESLPEAADVLAAASPGDAAIVAGGTDIIPNMKRRQQTPGTLVGLRRIAELRDVRSGGLPAGRDDGSRMAAEGLAIGAVVLLATSAALLSSASGKLRVDHQIALWLGAAACGSFVVYRRFGFVYAALSAMTCAALVPFQLSVSDPVQRVAAAAVCGVVFLLIKPKRARLGTEWPGDEFGYIQAAAWIGVYVALNVKLFPWIVVSGGGLKSILPSARRMPTTTTPYF